MTKPLTKKEYPSKNTFDLQEYIRQLVKRDEVEIETVVDLEGRAGNPIYQPCEIVY